MTRRWPILAIFVVSGAAGLIYEVVWARQLVLVFGNTTQAVSAILTGFFGGMAIGSVVGGRLGDRVKRPLRMYGLLELILVVVVLATPITFRLLHEVYRGAFGSLESAPAALALVRFALALVALGPATILMGATLPTLTRYLSRDPAQLSIAFGRLYAANTVGAIIGTIAAGFVLIELLGLTGTLLVGATCSALAGVIALLLDRSRGSLPAAASVPATATATVRAERASGVITPSTCPARPRHRLCVRVHLARLPDALDEVARVGDRQLHVRVHDDPRRVPHRPRRRSDRVRDVPFPDPRHASASSRTGRSSWPSSWCSVRTPSWTVRSAGR